MQYCSKPTANKISYCSLMLNHRCNVLTIMHVCKIVGSLLKTTLFVGGWIHVREDMFSLQYFFVLIKAWATILGELRCLIRTHPECWMAPLGKYLWSLRTSVAIIEEVTCNVALSGLFVFMAPPHCEFWIYPGHFLTNMNYVWISGTIWRHRCASTLFPNHCLDQCGLT